MEALEQRVVLSTITWDSVNHAAGGSWDDPNNWIGHKVPGAPDDAVINLTSTGTVTLSSNLADAVRSLTTNGNTSLRVENGSLALGAGSTTLGGPVTVDLGASLNVGAGASFLIAPGQTLTDNGTVSFAHRRHGDVGRQLRLLRRARSPSPAP